MVRRLPEAIYTPLISKAISLALVLFLLSVVSGQVFGQDSPNQITSQPDPRLGANLTTPSFGAVNAPKVAGAPLSPLPIQIASALSAHP